MTAVTLEKLTKTYPGGAGLHACDLAVAAGERFVLVGPSGAGKTTLLRLVAGLEAPDAGRVLLDGVPADRLPPHRRGLAYTPQRPAIFPHRTVFDNLAFGMDLRGTPRAEVERRVRNAAAILHITPLLSRRAQGLSAGEQQRVALGRGLARQAGLWLLDEPLAALDPSLRQELREELHLMQRRFNTTMIYITHDPIEGLALGHRIGVLADGRLQQAGEPDLLYHHPGNLRVACCLGWPPVNTFAGAVERDGAAARFRSDDGAVSLPLSGDWPGRLTLAFRAEDVEAGGGSPPGALALTGWTAETREPIAGGCVLGLRRGTARLRAWQARDAAAAPGAAWEGWVRREKLLFFDRDTEEAIQREI